MRWLHSIVGLLAAACLALPGMAWAQDHETDEADGVRITIIYDNTIYEDTEDVSADWGFSALIEVGEQQVLFDTGADGPRLLANMAALGIDPSAIDVIVLSHNHGDHTDGLDTLLTVGEAKPERIVVVPSVPEGTQAHMATYAEVVEAAPGLEIVPGVVSTGELTTGSFPEQAVLIETADGIIVLTGCAHPGIVEIVQAAQTLSDAPILLAMGGFHLLEMNTEQVQTIIEQLHALDVEQVAPSHCTGSDAIQVFAEDYGADYVALGVGRVLTFAALADPVE